jgi:hypothetical protein
MTGNDQNGEILDCGGGWRLVAGKDRSRWHAATMATPLIVVWAGFNGYREIVKIGIMTTLLCPVELVLELQMHPALFSRSRFKKYFITKGCE